MFKGLNAGHSVTTEDVKKVSYLLLPLDGSLTRLMPGTSLKKAQWLIVYCINNLMIDVCQLKNIS
jgi:hypothetical protein